MKSETFTTITKSDISILQNALRFYIQNYPILSERDQKLSLLRKLYSIECSLNKCPDKELYIQNI